MISDAIKAVLAADEEFRSNMPSFWEGDPLTDAIDELRKALSASPAEAALAGQQPVAWIPIARWNELNGPGEHVAVQTLVHRYKPRKIERYFPLYAAPVPAKAGGVRVKPLVWEEFSWSDGTETREKPFAWKAIGVGLVYRVVIHDSGNISLEVDGKRASIFATLEAARAAAQAHYEAAILSAIEPGESAIASEADHG